MFIAWINGNCSFADGATFSDCEHDALRKLPEIIRNKIARYSDRPEHWQRVLVTITEGARQRVIWSGRFETDEKMAKLLSGQRLIVDDLWLDLNADHPASSLVRTACNRNRLGIHDQYVAWIDDAAKPADLEIRPDASKGQVAVGSV